MIEFFDLQTLEIIQSGITKIPAYSEWPLRTMENLVLKDNPHLSVIEEAAFEISNLANVTIMRANSDNFTLESNSLNILSSRAGTLTLPNAENIEFKSDAFGVGFGAHPWPKLNIWTNNFPVEVFRPLLQYYIQNDIKGKFLS